MATRDHIDEGLARRTKALRETPEEERKKAWIEKVKSSLERVIAAASIAGFMKERVLKTASTGTAYYTEEYVDYNAFLKHLIELVYNLGDEDTWHPEGPLVFRADETINQVSIRDSVTRGPLVNMSDLNDALFNIMKDQRRDSAIFFGRMCAAFLTRRLGQDLAEKIRETLWSEVENSGLLESATSLGFGSKVKKSYRGIDAVENVTNISFKDKEVERICHENGIYTFTDALSHTEKVSSWWFRQNDKIETFEEYRLFKNLNSVDDFIFENCVNLEKIVLPENIKSIGKCAFSNCWSLTDFVFPKSVEVIGKQAFFGCDSLKKIILPEGLTSIGDEAFLNCTNLEVLFIPKTVSKIGDSIFGNIPRLQIFVEKGCPLINDIKERWSFFNIVEVSSDNELNESNLGLAKRVSREYDKKTEDDADVIENISNIVFDSPIIEKLCHDKGIFSKDDATNISTPGELWEIFKYMYQYKDPFSFKEFRFFTGLTKVAASLFSSSGLYEITLPASIKCIGEHAFRNTKLKKIVIPEGVEDIRDQAFQECSSLREVYIPNSLSHLGINVFGDCFSLNKFYVKTSCPENVIALISSMYPRVKICKIDSSDASINESRANLGLSKRVSREYSKKSEDDVVKEISYIQFEDPIVEETMHSLGIFTMQDAQNCRKDLLIRYKFYGTDIKSFNELKLFDNIEKFENFCFAQCSELSSIKLPRSLRSIPNGCFSGCVALKEIEIPNTVREICSTAFMSSQLSSIYIPDNVTKIGYGCFSHCKFLREVSLPAFLKAFGDDDKDVFYDCERLEVVNVRLAKDPWTVYDFKFFFKMIYDNVKEITLIKNGNFEKTKILYNGVEVEMDELGYPKEAVDLIAKKAGDRNIRL